MLAVLALPALAKGDWRGKVVDENGEPVAYANDAVTPENILSRDYGNWFPNVSYAGVIGEQSGSPVQVMLNYSAKTSRPHYGNLSSAIRYNSRYIWQSGNSRLQPEMSHNIGLTAVCGSISRLC